MPDAVILRRSVTVTNEQGLHFRPCQLIAMAAQQFHGTVYLCRGSTRADAKSLLELLTLAAEQGTILELEVTGQGGNDLVEKVSELFLCGFQTPHQSV